MRTGAFHFNKPTIIHEPFDAGFRIQTLDLSKFWIRLGDTPGNTTKRSRVMKIGYVIHGPTSQASEGVYQDKKSTLVASVLKRSTNIADEPARIRLYQMEDLAVLSCGHICSSFVS